ncbi:phospholipase/carboxylesterase family protein-like protein [Plenodomus tracheiphilus IPT5]|uniref:Phospholipase/carboxylesterase family protein-like protein n=1 Tax=Plenodomus tracheiphilus IPT5 TaxID=1408161 RepID=A0A6A7BFL8_9PLEO|nr:phospholipase/carboxylesterase family protein-like protein [Plenodomus tracheiphilus IPT5]
MYQSSLSSNAPNPPPSTTTTSPVSPPSHIIPPTPPHTHTIIFLHGRDSSAETFADELFESQTSSGKHFTTLFPSLKWVFPCAPKSYSALDQEEVSQWFEMSSVQRPQEDVSVQKAGLWESVGALRKLVQQEAEIVGGMQNVILAGISQGCATAIFTLLTSGWGVGGFVGVAGWLPFAEELGEVMDVPGRLREFVKTPVLLQHCRDDEVVPVGNGEDLRTRLERWGMRVAWQEYEKGGHWLQESEGMDGIVKFLQKCMER